VRWLVIGAGGHGEVVADAIREAWADASIAGHLDDDTAKHGSDVLGARVLGAIDSIAKWPHDAVALGIGDNGVRERLFARLSATERLPAVVHPRAAVAKSARVGDASVLFAGAVVNAGATIGEGAIVNTGATVDHDCVLEPYAHVGPGSHVNGACVIGRGALLTTGVIVGRGAKIGARAVVGAGAVVIEDLPPKVLAYGVPARVVKRLDGDGLR